MPKRINGDANGLHKPGRDEIPTTICGGIRLDKLCELQSGETENTNDDKNYNYSLEKKKRPRVQRLGDAAVDDSTVRGNTVAKPTLHSPNYGTVFVNTVLKKILNKLSIASQLEFTENM